MKQPSVYLGKVKEMMGEKLRGNEGLTNRNPSRPAGILPIADEAMKITNEQADGRPERTEQWVHDGTAGSTHQYFITKTRE
jgi:hypothetical protein